jgi:IPT/TIG domain-containing protein
MPKGKDRLPHPARPCRRGYGGIGSLAAFLVGVALGTLPATPASAVFDGTWTAITPTGPLPLPRRDVGMIHDPVRDRVVVVGGGGETWVLPLAAPTSWAKLQISLYASPGFERAIYDPVGDRMIMINSSMQVFELSLGAPTGWAQVATSGQLPPARTFFAVAHDELRNRLIVYGGGPYTGIFSDIWVLTLDGTPTWSRIIPSGSGPVPTWAPLAFYDPAQDRLVVGMGAADVQYTVNANLFAVNLSGPPAWQAILPAGPIPSGRLMTSIVYDPGLNRAILFGGTPGTGTDTWSLELGSQPVWVQLSPSGSTPRRRWSSAMAYRPGSPPTEPSILLFGGHDGADFTDLWSLGSTFPAGPPVVTAFSPSGGRVGDPVNVLGLRLSNATEVTFNGQSAPVLETYFGHLVTQVPPGATTGPIAVTTPLGSASSVGSFFVGEEPVISSIEPDSGRTGDAIRLRGMHFFGTTSVVLGGTGNALFTVVDDTTIDLVVDSLATTGPVSVTTPAATGTSEIVFTALADDPRPHLLSVSDVKDDQGGRVILRWRASDLDQIRYRRITGYRVWRRAPPNGAASAHGSLGAVLPGSRVSLTVAPDVFWENLVELPAAFLKGYAYAAATLRDSTETGNPYTAYFVQAITANQFEFYNSSPDSGYSVDNLSPPMPLPFTATFAAGSNALHWTASRAPDLREFRLHRGHAPDFVPGPSNLILASRDTGYVDGPGAVYYKLGAVDVHGNASRYALVSPASPVAALVSLVSATASADRVRLIWYTTDNASVAATVYRRTLDSDWNALDRISADGGGLLEYEDAAVTAGVRYGYRLGVSELGQEMVFGETWLDVPRPQLALRGAIPNPTPARQLRVGFTLTGDGPATLDVVDVAGRIIRAAEVGSLGPGEHEVVLPNTSTLRPGIYFARLRQGGAEVRSRFAVVQ